MRQLEVRGGGLEMEEIGVDHGNTKLSGQSGQHPVPLATIENIQDNLTFGSLEVGDKKSW